MSIIQSIFAPRAETTTLSAPAQWIIDAITGGETSSGMRVNLKTALGLPTLLDCVRCIAEDIGKLPKGVLQKVSDGREERPDHACAPLVDREPNETMNEQVFHETLTGHALTLGGGFAEIVRNGAGVPVAMYALNPFDVRVEVSADGTRKRFIVRQQGGADVVIANRDMIHLLGFGFDGLTGYNVINVARDAIGAALATQNHRSRWFGNGAQPSGVLQVPAGFSPTAMENLRASFKERQEGAENKGKTLMLEAGVTWQQVSVDAQKAMMIEALSYDDKAICRLFRMPPQKIGVLDQAAGWSTLGQLNRDYAQGCLSTWMRRWETEYRIKLFGPRERDYYVKFNDAALMRGDPAEQAELYQSGINNGYMCPNDVRSLLDMNKIPGGDKFYRQGAIVRVDLADRKTEAEIEKVEAETKAAENPPEPPAPAPKPAPKEPVNRLSTLISLARVNEPLLEEAFARVLRTEATKVEQARKKGNAESLCETFYKDHADYVISKIGVVIEAFWVAATGNKVEMSLIRDIAAMHTDESVATIANDIDTAGWTDGSRAASQAKHWMARMIELIAGASNDTQTG